MQITILATISRPQYIDSVITQIVEICHFTHTYEIILAIDNREIEKSTVMSAIKQSKKPNLFQKVKLFNTNKPRPRVLDMIARRNRIKSLHNMARQYLGNSEMTFVFEDDTVLPPDVVLKLLGDYIKANTRYRVGIIQGVQVGRWGVEYIGAWQVDDLIQPNEYKTLPFSTDQQLQHIDAGGFYCFIVPTNLYRSVDIDWQEPTGPDVYFGLELKRKGYSNFIDWEVICGHMTKKDTLWPTKKCKIVEFNFYEKRWHNKIVSL